MILSIIFCQNKIRKIKSLKKINNDEIENNKKSPGQGEPLPKFLQIFLLNIFCMKQNSKKPSAGGTYA